MNRPEATTQKRTGAFYTPTDVARTLVAWAVRSATDRLLDPSCGDGRFLSLHPNSVGIEQDPASAQAAIASAPSALVHEGEFFAWAPATHERFECAAGNPPFIRYQFFRGATRARALALCQAAGAKFSGLTSSWAPFLVAVSGLLKPEGRMAFVIPAEIGHAPYASPVLEHLTKCFSTVKIIAVRDKIFPQLSEDCWLLYADGYGGNTSVIELTIVDNFCVTLTPPPTTLKIEVSEWRQTWQRRLRPFLMPTAARTLYQLVASDPASFRLSQAAQTGIGYVSGANDFFHLRTSDAKRWNIPDALLMPSVRNSKSLPQKSLTKAAVARWRRDDEPVLLLRLSKTDSLPVAVKRYLDSEAGVLAKTSYKCRVREPWWSVPDVRVPDYFLSYMSGKSPALVHNSARTTCTNSVHAVQTLDKNRMIQAGTQWNSAFVKLSCELEGHPLGGGMLKLEPREAGRILFPSSALAAVMAPDVVQDALLTLRRWRHYAS